jgi:hypothetical protein
VADINSPRFPWSTEKSQISVTEEAMFTWLSTARKETCRACGGLATLLARTRRCPRCEADTYDREMGQYGWWSRAPMMRREQDPAGTA